MHFFLDRCCERGYFYFSSWQEIAITQIVHLGKRRRSEFDNEPSLLSNIVAHRAFWWDLQISPKNKELQIKLPRVIALRCLGCFSMIFAKAFFGSGIVPFAS